MGEKWIDEQLENYLDNYYSPALKSKKAKMRAKAEDWSSLNHKDKDGAWRCCMGSEQDEQLEVEITEWEVVQGKACREALREVSQEEEEDDDDEEREEEDELRSQTN